MELTGLELKVWILTAALAFASSVSLVVIGFLLSREFKRKDDMQAEFKDSMADFSQVLEKVSSTVQALTVALEELKFWSSERFVNRVEFQNEFEKCKRTCLYRQKLFLQKNRATQDSLEELDI